MLNERFTNIKDTEDFTASLSFFDRQIVEMTAANFDSGEIASKLDCDFFSVHMKRAIIFKDFNSFVLCPK
jgi:FixJ family two-component response regulator